MSRFNQHIRTVVYAQYSRVLDPGKMIDPTDLHFGSPEYYTVNAIYQDRCRYLCAYKRRPDGYCTCTDLPLKLKLYPVCIRLAFDSMRNECSVILQVVSITPANEEMSLNLSYVMMCESRARDTELFHLPNCFIWSLHVYVKTFRTFIYGVTWLDRMTSR